MLKPLTGFQFGSFPIYQIMIFIGCIAALMGLNRSLKRIPFSHYSKKRIRRSFYWGGIFGLAGANIVNWFFYENAFDYSLYHRITQGGFSFFFGMVCFFGVSAILLRLHKTDVGYCLNMFVPSILILQFFARLGCNLRGCCWGADVTLFGTTFPLPLRELEAIFTLVMLFVLITYKHTFQKRLPVYLFSYSIFRFVADFFRGDNHGSIFGITALTPTQVAAILVAVFSAIALFTRPVLRLFNAEPLLDKLKGKVFRKKYEPLPHDYFPAVNKHSTAKRVVAVVLAVTMIVTAICYANPLKVSWIDEIRYNVEDALSFLYNNKATEDTIGDTNGITAVDISDNGIIKDEKDALEVAEKYDNWANLKFNDGRVDTLDSGEHIYTFTQTVDGKPVLGKTRTVVTDADNNALYMLGDAASLSYTKDTIAANTAYSPTVKEAFGEDVKTLEEMDCWYDSGNGLVDAYQAILSDDGETPTLGVIVQKSDDKILRYTDPELGVITSTGSKNIRNSANKIINLLKNKNDSAIKEIGKKKKADNALKQKAHRLERALCIAFEKSELSHEEFAEILALSASIAEKSSSANGNLLKELIAEQAKKVSLERGATASEAEKCAKQVRKGFEKAGFDASDDESATDIQAVKRRSTFRHSIDFDNDTDVFSLTGTEDYSTELTLSVDTPISIEVYDRSGRAVVSMYVDDEETIVLYPEDGSDFVIKIIDSNAELEGLDSKSDYKIVTKAVPVEIPDKIETVIRRIEDAYNASNSIMFVSMLSDDENELYIEEAIGIGALTMMTDSCGACAGMEDGLDTAKTLIAGTLVFNGSNNKDFELLRGSEMELTYVNHVDNGNGVALKMKLKIELDGLTVYSGHVFLQLEFIEDRTTFSDLNSESDLRDLFTCLYGDNYYITDANSSSLFNAFGNAYGDVQSESDLPSLYELWRSRTEDIGDGLSVELKSIDESSARAKGHNAEKIEGFKKFTARHNLMSLKSMRTQLEVCMETMNLIGTYGGDVSDLISFVAGFSAHPFLASFVYLGNQIDKQDGDNNVLWKCIKGGIDLKDVMMDDFKNMLFAEAKKEAERYAALISEVDRMITREESVLNG